MALGIEVAANWRSFERRLLCLAQLDLVLEPLLFLTTASFCGQVELYDFGKFLLLILLLRLCRSLLIIRDLEGLELLFLHLGAIFFLKPGPICRTFSAQVKFLEFGGLEPILLGLEELVIGHFSGFEFGLDYGGRARLFGFALASQVCLEVEWLHLRPGLN